MSSWGHGIIQNYNEAFAVKAEQARKIDQLEARVNAYKNMIERRDDAIAASACKVKIKGWLNHPETLPMSVPTPLGPLHPN
jgi:formate dehydrogenase assembly factor FdhD